MILRSRLRPHVLALVAATVAVAVSGCGAGATPAPAAAATHTTPAATGPAPTPTPTSALPDLCHLISADDVSQEAGVHITAVEPKPDNNIITCEYSWANRLKFIFVQYQLHSKGALDYTKAHGGQAVPGLGDEAYWFPTGFDLHVALNGDDQLIVNMADSDVALNHGNLKAVAIAIATHAVPLVLAGH